MEEEGRQMDDGDAEMEGAEMDQMDDGESPSPQRMDDEEAPEN